VAPKLIPHLTDEDWHVREATAQTFMGFGGQAAPQLPALQRALANEPQPEVAKALRNAIAEIQRQVPARGRRGGH
jgi:hypothetical protein